MICLKEILIHHAKSNVRWLSIMKTFFDSENCVPATRATRGDFIFKQDKRVFINTSKQNCFTDRHTCSSVCAISRRGEIVCKCTRVKITRAKKTPVHISCCLIFFTPNVNYNYGRFHLVLSMSVIPKLYTSATSLFGMYHYMCALATYFEMPKLLS